MNGADEYLDDFEEALEKLGPKCIAQCFIQAYDFFQKNKSKLPESKQKELTAKQWKTLEQEEEEEENDEAAFDEEAESEEDEDGEGGDDEPPQKKAKTG